jgi:N-acetylneuraminic acid mutarotase
VPRGDVHAATGPTSASLGGGFTDADGFCAPLPSVESYSFDTNQWSFLPNLINERGEAVFVELDDHLYAMGGERQIEDICDVTVDTDPGELTVGTDLVEVLDGGEWNVLDNFPNHKFRFAAVGVDETGLIYAFGGQTAWNSSCQCFKTSDDVQVFGEEVQGSDAETSINGLVLSLATGMVTACVWILF